jgi:Holliday junction resolvase YEN1
LQAPGEAEAELAKLNAEGEIDAVITDNSDVWAFGAHHVIRRYTTVSLVISVICGLRICNLSSKPGSRDLDRVKVYSSDVIEHSDITALTRGGSILIVLLAGGDYDQGVVSIGARIVHSLAMCGYGNTLIEAALAENQDMEGLRQFIKTWCEDLCSELVSDSRGILGRCYGMLAAKIPSSFPSPETLKLYVNPITSWSPGYIPPDSSAWRPREPTIHKITLFSIHHLGWTTGKDLLKRFRANLWSGVCFHMFCMVSSQI